MKKIYVLIFCVSSLSATAPESATFSKGIKKDHDYHLRAPKPIAKPKKERKGRKRKGLTHLTERKTFTQMTFEELTVAKNEQKENNNTETAAKYLERLFVLSDDIDQKAEILIELADLLFKTEKYEDAEKRYTEFVDLYPGNTLIEHASYRAIVCLSNKILTPDRDQTKTQEAIERADKFLERASVFTTYADKVREIRFSACKTLVANQFDICQTSMKLGNYEGAQKRLELVRNQWLIQLPEIAPTLALLEVELSQQYKEFVPSAESFKLAELAQEIKPKKTDMTVKF